MEGKKVLQGNLDPAALYAEDEVLISQTKKMLDQYSGDRHIANLGHGVYPDISPDKVRLFVQTVKDYSRNKI
jgi:uroporphyrinogen decarboxylase